MARKSATKIQIESPIALKDTPDLKDALVKAIATATRRKGRTVTIQGVKDGDYLAVQLLAAARASASKADVTLKVINSSTDSV